METEKIQWEYLILVCRIDQSNGFRPKISSINGKSPNKVEREINMAFFGTKLEKTLDTPWLDEYLPELGKLGWEVCSSSAIDAPGEHYICLILNRTL